ncbi:MAG: zinc ribbon domain-containing protein [Xanthomonadales bacterium]|jgi:hypothetical protein|nr:zinc ribbon domain-containing protein [Xanthomonadales bacterium]
MTSRFRSLFLLALWPALALAADPPADNRPPQVLALNVTPAAPKVGDAIRLRAFAEDPDADPLRWRWSINDQPLPDELPELSLDPPDGGEYRVRAVADDGRGGRAEAELRFKVFQPTWCREAEVYHDAATLEAFYSGAPSLTMSREALVDGFVQVLRDYRAAGGTPDLGVTSADPLSFAQRIDSAAPTDPHAAALQQQANARAAALGRGLNPPELFAIALEVTGGQVHAALLAAHAATVRDAPRNAAFVREQLAPLRDPRGYSGDAALKVWNDSLQTWQFVSAAALVSDDQQGVWYRLYGTAALRLADHRQFMPFWLLQQGAGHFPSARNSAPQDGLSAAALGRQLSDYALQLQTQVGAGARQPPDPDRTCIDYSGVAIGAALARELAADPASDPPALSAAPGTPAGSYRIQWPLSIEIAGVNGEVVGFDSRSGQFQGNSANAIVDFDPAADPPTVVITPLFAVRELTLRSTAAGAASFGAADLEAGFTRVWALSLEPDASFRYEPAYALRDASGTALPPAAEMHHQRQWAFPQAPMLIIAMTSGLGLLLGLIFVWRRGPFAAPPRLPPGGERTPALCPSCGASTRPGARFCRQCGHQLR